MMALHTAAGATRGVEAGVRLRSAATLGLVDALLTPVRQEAAGVLRYGLADALVVKTAEAELVAAEAALAGDSS
jgi:hypothetical protein